MKKILFAILMSNTLLAQDSADEVKIVLNEQVQSWNNGDIDGFMQGYWKSDSLRFIGKKGVTYGWKPVLENYKKSYSTRELMGDLTFTSLDFTLLSVDAVFVTGSWKISYSEKDSLGGWFSLLFRKIDGKWVIVADHTS